MKEQVKHFPACRAALCLSAWESDEQSDSGLCIVGVAVRHTESAFGEVCTVFPTEEVSHAGVDEESRARQEEAILNPSESFIRELSSIKLRGWTARKSWSWDALLAGAKSDTETQPAPTYDSSRPGVQEAPNSCFLQGAGCNPAVCKHLLRSLDERATSRKAQCSREWEWT